MIATHGLTTLSAHYTRMGQQECAKIHEATLEILEELGGFAEELGPEPDGVDFAP